jgi:hypothetical protein
MTFVKNSKIKFVIFIFLLFIGLFLIFSSGEKINAQAYHLGSGTQADPYQISTVDDLAQLNTDVLNNNQIGLYFKLVNDIDVKDHELATIGLSGEKEFAGNFDGNNYIIYNIYGENKSAFKGLFYKIATAGKVSNLGLYNANLHSQDNVGGIAVINAGTIQKCFFSGNITTTSVGGGLVAINDGGQLSLSFSAGNIFASMSARAGGLIGEYRGGRVENNYSIVNLGSDGVVNIDSHGGLIGYSTIQNYADIRNNSFGRRDTLEYNTTTIPGHNADLRSVANLSISNERKIPLDNYQDKSLFVLFGAQEQQWERETKPLAGDGIFGPYIKGFIKSGTEPIVLKHNHMVRYAPTVKYFGYDEKYQSNWGTSANALMINNATQFHIFSYNVSLGRTYENKYLKLGTTNLSFGNSPISALNGIGLHQQISKPFKGTFDGNNNEISSFYVQKSNDTTALGFFNYVENATIKNLKISSNTTVDGTGVNVVGGLVGRAKNSVFENLFIQTTVQNVSRGGSIGGIIADNSAGTNGSIKTVMFYGQLLPFESGAPEGVSIGGIVAREFDEKLTSSKCLNAWHFVSHNQSFLDGYLNFIGNIFIDTNSVDSNIKSTASMVDEYLDGEMRKTFRINTVPDVSLLTEYRYLDETVAPSQKPDANNYYTRYAESSLYNQASSIGQKVFARYVRGIDIIANYEDDEGYSALGRYYVGQNVNLFMDLRDGFYLTSVIGHVDSTNEDLLDLPFENNALEGFYNKVGFKNVVFGGESIIKDTYFKIIFNFAKINFTTGFFGEDAGEHSHIYCGAPITVDTTLSSSYKFNESEESIHALAHYENIAANKGVKANYEGIAPMDANTVAISKYYLDYVIYTLCSDKKVYLGKRQIGYTITKKEISIPNAAINTTKEYNGKTAVEETTTVDNALIPDIFEIDKSKVIIDATIIYNENIGETTASVSLSIHDKGSPTSRNYQFASGEEEKSGIAATVLKRKIYLPLSEAQNLNKEYDGQGPDILPSIENSNVDGVSLIKRSDFNFTYTRIGGEAGMLDSLPGTFKVEVSFKEASSSNYFEIGFTENLENTAYLPADNVLTTIAKRQISIEYFNVENLVYDGLSKEITLKLIPQYTNFNNQVVSLGETKIVSYEISFNGGTVSDVLNAGTYLINAIDFVDADTYTLDAESTAHKFLVVASSTSKEVVVNKAHQSQINITSATEYSYSSTANYLFTATGGEVGNYIYSIDIHDSRNNAEGEILENNELVVTNVGTFVVIAERVGNDNYHPVYSTPFLLVVSKSIATLSISDLEVFYGKSITPQFLVNNLEDLPSGFVAPSISISKASENMFTTLNPNQKYVIGEYKLRVFANNAISNVVEFENVAIFANLTIAKRNVTLTILEDIETTYGVDVVIPYSKHEDDADLEINGQLSRQEGIAAGTYDIENGNLAEENPYLNITVNTQGYKYIIKKAVLEFSFAGMEKRYGEADPTPQIIISGLKYQDTVGDIGLNYQFARVPGESVRVEGYAYYLPSNPSLTNTNYEIVFKPTQEGKLFIRKANVIVKNLKTINKPVLEELTPYNVGEDDKIADFYVRNYNNGVWEEISVQGQVKWSDASLSSEFKMLDFKASQTLIRSMEFTIDEGELVALQNYEVISSFDVTINPIKREALAIFTNVPNLKYKGSAYSLADVTSLELKEKISDEAISINEIEILAPAEIKNAGNYTITVKFKGHNYNFTGGSLQKINTFNIAKAKLEVKLQDMTYKDNNVPTKATLVFNGFVGEEGVTMLQTAPSCALPSEAGVYSIAPSGGVSTNYSFEYVEGNIIVKKHEIASVDKGVKATFYGEYDPTIEVTLDETTDAYRLSQTQAQIKLLSKTKAEFANKKAELILQVRGAKGEEVQTGVGADKIVFEVPELYANETNIMVMVVDVNNNVTYANVTVEDGFITLDGEDIEYIVFVSEKPPYVMYAGIGVAGLILIVVLFVVIKNVMKKKKEAKYVKFKQVHEK